jgi:hypothetical protein
MRFSCHYKRRGKLGMKTLHTMTYSLGPESSGVVPRKFNGVAARNAADFMACINLLRHKRLRGGNKYNLALREPSIDYGTKINANRTIVVMAYNSALPHQQ